MHAPEAEGGEGAAGASSGGQAPAPAPTAVIRDEIKLWEEIAARAYAADGVLEGWDDDKGKPKKTAEEKFMEVLP